eukprot:6210055-Pleurochrysis_carterae.AAC.1
MIITTDTRATTTAATTTTAGEPRGPHSSKEGAECARARVHTLQDCAPNAGPVEARPLPLPILPSCQPSPSPPNYDHLMRAAIRLCMPPSYVCARVLPVATTTTTAVATTTTTGAIAAATMMTTAATAVATTTTTTTAAIVATDAVHARERTLTRARALTRTRATMAHGFCLVRMLVLLNYVEPLAHFRFPFVRRSSRLRAQIGATQVCEDLAAANATAAVEKRSGKAVCAKCQAWRRCLRQLCGKRSSRCSGTRVSAPRTRARTEAALGVAVTGCRYVRRDGHRLCPLRACLVRGQVARQWTVHALARWLLTLCVLVRLPVPLPIALQSAAASEQALERSLGRPWCEWCSHTAALAPSSTHSSCGDGTFGDGRPPVRMPQTDPVSWQSKGRQLRTPGSRGLGFCVPLPAYVKDLVIVFEPRALCTPSPALLDEPCRAALL